MVVVGFLVVGAKVVLVLEAEDVGCSVEPVLVVRVEVFGKVVLVRVVVRVVVSVVVTVVVGFVDDVVEVARIVVVVVVVVPAKATKALLFVWMLISDVRGLVGHG